MSKDGSVIIPWPDEERRYRLDIGQLMELQDKCAAGPVEICEACSNKTWRVQWIRETIRLGLIGGGLDPTRALALVARYVKSGSLLACAEVAQAILLAALVGDTVDVVGKDQAGEVTENPDASPSRLSSEPVLPSASPLAKSGNAAFGSSTPQ